MSPCLMRKGGALDVWQWAVGVLSQYTTSDYYGGSNRLGFMEKYVHCRPRYHTADVHTCSHRYLVTSLDLDLNKDASGIRRGRVRLSDVENALSRLAAAYFWSCEFRVRLYEH